MNRAQKQTLAQAMIQQVANMKDTWDDIVQLNPSLAEVEPSEAFQVIAQWLKPLPGDCWDVRLPDPR